MIRVWRSLSFVRFGGLGLGFSDLYFLLMGKGGEVLDEAFVPLFIMGVCVCVGI